MRSKPYIEFLADRIVVLNWIDGFILIFSSFSPAVNPASGRPEREEEAAGRSVLRPIQICLATPSLKKAR
jgi:hypothetical protein